MAGIYIPWLADAARSTGYPVVEEAGWKTRGRSGFRVVEGVVGHHTAGAKTGEYPSRNIILNGRKGLSGPLANFGLGRSGTIYVVAAGAANHAGVSDFAGFTNLNDEFIGIEAEDDGDGTWTDAQKDAYPRLVAALLIYMNRPASRYAGHKDVANPPGRKPDPKGIDTEWMRSQAGIYIKDRSKLNKNAPAVRQPTQQPVVKQSSAKPAPQGHTYKPGDKGEPVKAIQKALGFTDKNTDGDYGPRTKNAVIAFQKRSRLPATGSVDPKTWSILRKY